MKLEPQEVELIGQWTFDGKSMILDSIAERIEKLTSEFLIFIAEDETGWIKLYRDPHDGRFWELTYPYSDNHGGGAPMLKNISLADSKHKFNNWTG